MINGAHLNATSKVWDNRAAVLFKILRELQLYYRILCLAMSDTLPNPSGLSAKVNKKRKRQAEEAPKEDKAASAKSANNNTLEAAEGPLKKKKKRNFKNKQKQQKKKDLEDDPKQQERKGGIDESIGKMDGRLLADYFVQKAKRHNKELTAVELGDLSVPGMVISAWLRLKCNETDTTV